MENTQMKRITPAQRIVGETPYHSAGYMKPTAILLLLLGAALSGKAQTIYVLNGINVGGNYGNHESTIGEYTAAGVPVKTALVTVPGADMESIALAESLTMNGVPGPKLFVADLNNNVVSVYDAISGALVNGSLVPKLVAPRAVAVFGSNLYVLNGLAGNGIYQCDAATGTGCIAVGNVTFGQYLAAATDGAGGVNVFVTSNNSGSGTANTGSVALINISAAGVTKETRNFITGLNYPEGVAVSVDGSTLYVTSGSGLISEYSVASPSTSVLLDNVGYPAPYGLAVFGSNLLAALNSTGEVGDFSANTANTGNFSLITGLSYPTGIAAWNGCVPAPSGLSAWWTLMEASPTLSGYRDWTGNMEPGWGHNGVQVVMGEVDNAAKFNGETQYIEIPNGPALNVGPAAANLSGDFSIDAWLKLDACTPALSCAADAGVRVILEKRTFTPPSTYTGFSLYLYNQYLGLQLADDGAAPGYTNYGAPNLVVPADGQWHFVAVSITRPSAAGFSVQFTLDNEPAVALTSPARMGSLTNSSVARIGMETISNGSVFNGSIDEVEFFNGRAVTYSEWQSIYDAGTYGKCKQIYSIQ